MTCIANLTFHQKQLHQRFKYFGSKHLEFRQKCIGLLPQILKEKIYEKKGFGSIFEYAAKLAGLSREQVKRALSLHEKFEDKPALKYMLENGEVSINKLAKIASIASTKNQELPADQVKLLPCRALETLARDERIYLRDHEKSEVQSVEDNRDEDSSPSQVGLFEPKNDHKIVHVNKSLTEHDPEKLQLSEDVKQKLLDLQKKGIDVNNLILRMLKKRELEIAIEKEEMAAEEIERKSSRYIPIKIRKLLNSEHGTKCSIPTCNKPSSQIHHTQRFALAGMHDPRFLAPLCENHHKIAHVIDVKMREYAVRH
jgi:hypothetical protein